MAKTNPVDTEWSGSLNWMFRLPGVGYPLLPTLMEHLHCVFHLVTIWSWYGTKYMHINSQGNIKIYTIKVKEWI